jgi:glucose-6-phosphate dehydrogenase assembly protein OpcA
MAFDSSFLGLPVELSQISSTLKSLWDTPEQRTRACLLNLVVLCQGTQNLATNTELIAKFVRSHACRAILVGDVPSEKVQKASAWIQAHCHMTKAGAQEICSEQITLLAEGLSQTTIANMIMANLDYDLPLNLWWQGDLPPNIESPLWQRVDRLIVDSLDWQDPKEDLRRAFLLKEQFGDHLTLADLNWTRTLSLRQALAISFDSPPILAELDKIERLEIHHAPKARLTALLLASWFGAQLSWTVADHTAKALYFSSRSGRQIECTLVETPGETISSVTVNASNSSLSIHRELGSVLLDATLKSAAGTQIAHFPAGSSDFIGLLTEEMMPGTQHKIYLKALSALRALLS